MSNPRCLVVSAILISLGLGGCGESEQVLLKTDGENPSASASVAVGPATSPGAGNSAGGDVTPEILPQPVTPESSGDPVGDADSVADQTGTDDPDSDVNATDTSNGSDTGGENSAEENSDTNASDPAQEPDITWWQPKASENLTWQWQLQGKIDTSLPVQVYNIDIEAPQKKIDELKERDIKLICYFSAGTVERFRSDSRLFPEDITGEQYEDLKDERWVDYGQIDVLAPIMRARLDKCKSKGFDAVEIDNVDAHNYESRDEQGEVINIGTNFKMTLDESIAYVRWLTKEAHSRGLGIGLKNAEEMVPDVVDEVDWMLVEDCYYDSWCYAATAFIDADKPVFMAEYDELVPDFAPACELAKSLGYFAIWRDSSLSTELYLACE